MNLIKRAGAALRLDVFSGKPSIIKMDEVASFILAMALSVTSMSLYGESIPEMTGKCFLIGIFTLAMCAFVNRNRFIGAFVTIVYLAVYFAGMMNIITIGERDTGVYFWQWLVSGGSAGTLEIEAGSDGMLRLGMYLAVTLFFVISIYYFSVANYRFGYITLVSLLPFVLYAKVTEEVENRYLVLVVLVSMLMHVVCARKVSPTRAEIKEAKRKSSLFHRVEPVHGNDWNIKIRGQWVYMAQFAVAVILVVALAALVPKDPRAKYYDKFEDMFLGGNTDTEVGESFSNLSEFSGNADNFSSGTNRRLYTVVGDGDIYLKRQVFDVYDFEKDRWYSLDGAVNETDFDAYFRDKKLLSISGITELIKAVNEIDKGFAARYGLEEVAEGNTIPDVPTNYVITAQNFSAAYYLSADRLSDVKPESGDAYITDAGTMFRKESLHAQDHSYTISVFNKGPAFTTFRVRGGLNLAAKDEVKMLDEAEKILVEESLKRSEIATKSGKNLSEEENEELARLLRNIRVCQAFREDVNSAVIYSSKVSSAQGEIPEDIAALARETTADCKNDYEKAEALEKYFRENGFLYDLKYRAPDNSPGYFLFEGKTGTCSDYASAFVLLARSAGLMTRYVEGFVPEGEFGDLYRVITEADSHAYAEVFIENVGWMSFDPTAGVRNVGGNSFFSLLQKLKVDIGLLQVIGGFAILIAGIIFFARLVIPFLSEAIFRLLLIFTKPEKALLSSYKRLIKKMKKSGKAPGLTPGEMEKMASDAEIDISDYICNVERFCFAGKEIKIGRRGIIRGYAAGCKAVRKSQRGPRKG